MKKFLSLLLTCVLIISFSLPAYAESTVSQKETPPVAVYDGKTYVMEHEGGDIYSIEVPLTIKSNDSTNGNTRSGSVYVGVIQISCNRQTYQTTTYARVTASNDLIKKVVCQYTLSTPGFYSSKSNTTLSSYIPLQSLTLNPVTFLVRPSGMGPYAITCSVYGTVTGVKNIGIVTGNVTVYV